MSADPMQYVVPFNPNENSQTYWGASPSPADLARGRKNQQIDTKRKEGTQARQILQQQGQPAQPQQPKPQAQAGQIPLPQYQAPPAYTPPQFTPAQYHPPAKGLEYLGLGLSLLFPGSPIAGAAKGLLSGLQQRSQNTYNREEKTAEQQYQVQSETTKAAYENALQQSKANFENDQIRYQAAVENRSRGLNPDGTPMALPAVESFLPKQVDPRTGKPVVDQSAGGFAKAYRQAAIAASRMGADSIAKQYETQATQYEQDARAEMRDAAMLQRELISQQEQDAREARREAASDARQAAREDRADARAMALIANPKQQAQLRDEYAKGTADFYGSWRKATEPPKSTLTGQVMPGSVAPVNGALLQALPKTFSKIDRDSDPVAAAAHYAESVSNPTAKQLIMERGRLADIARRSQGQPIIPHTFVKAPPLTAVKGLEPSPQATPALGGEAPKIQQGIQALQGKSPQEQERLIEATSNFSPEEKSALRSALGLPVHVPGP